MYTVIINIGTFNITTVSSLIIAHILWLFWCSYDVLSSLVSTQRNLCSTISQFILRMQFILQVYTGKKIKINSRSYLNLSYSLNYKLKWGPRRWRTHNGIFHIGLLMLVYRYTIWTKPLDGCGFLYLVVKHALGVKKLMFIKVIKNIKKSLNPVLVEGVLVIKTGVPFLDYWKSLPDCLFCSKIKLCA